jgi:hypothetical protein
MKLLIFIKIYKKLFFIYYILYKSKKMRFKFCGNVDCPDWLITEIIYISKITPVKLRILGNLICKYIMKEGDTVKIKKILEEMNLSPEEITIVISSLCFIIKSSAKFNIDDMMLSQELQQLGLPQDTADAISKVFKKNKDVLRNYLKEDIFSFKRVSDVHYKTSYCMADKYNNFDCTNEKENEAIEDNYIINSLEKAEITLCFDLKGKDKKKDGDKYLVNMDKETLGKLIQDLEYYSSVIKKYKEEA